MKHIFLYLATLGLVSMWQVVANADEQSQKLRGLIDRLEDGADASKRTATNTWGVATNNVQLSIKIKDGTKQIQTNGPITLGLAVKNVSTNETFWFHHSTRESFWPGFEFDVTTPSAKKERLNLTWPVGQNSSGQIVNVPPRQAREIELNMSRVFKLDEIGNYKIVATLTILSPANQKPFTVVSNPLLLTIAPKQPEKP